MNIKPDWNTAPDEATHALTTGPMWNGHHDLIGDVVFAQLIGEQFTAFLDGEVEEYPNQYNIRATGWLILEVRPEPQIDLCCSNLCDKELLEKELKCKGAKGLYEQLRKDMVYHQEYLRKSYQEYIAYVMHEE